MHLPTCHLIFLFVACSQIPQAKAGLFKDSMEWTMTHISNLLEGHGWNGDPERKAAIQKGNEEFIRCGGGLSCTRKSSGSAARKGGSSAGSSRDTPTEADESADCIEHQDEIIHWIRHQIAEWIRRRDGGDASEAGTNEQNDEMDNEVDENVAELTDKQKMELIKWIKERLGNYHSGRSNSGSNNNGNVGQGVDNRNCEAYKERLVNLLIQKLGESLQDQESD